VRWGQGRSVVDAMLDKRELERVTPSAEHAAELIAQARRHAASAERIAEADPAGAFQLLYDAARKALVAILENQGLRPTSRGGHIAVLEAVSAQLDPPMGKVIRPFDRLRRQRNSAEYPRSDTPPFTAEAVLRDSPKIRDIVDLAQRVIGQMSPY
jgi:HEPN domain